MVRSNDANNNFIRACHALIKEEVHNIKNMWRDKINSDATVKYTEVPTAFDGMYTDGIISVYGHTICLDKSDHDTFHGMHDDTVEDAKDDLYGAYIDRIFRECGHDLNGHAGTIVIDSGLTQTLLDRLSGIVQADCVLPRSLTSELIKTKVCQSAEEILLKALPQYIALLSDSNYQLGQEDKGLITYALGKVDLTGLLKTGDDLKAANITVEDISLCAYRDLENITSHTEIASQYKHLSDLAGIDTEDLARKQCMKQIEKYFSGQSCNKGNLASKIVTCSLNDTEYEQLAHDMIKSPEKGRLLLNAIDDIGELLEVIYAITEKKIIASNSAAERLSLLENYKTVTDDCETEPYLQLIEKTVLQCFRELGNKSTRKQALYVLNNKEVLRDVYDLHLTNAEIPFVQQYVRDAKNRISPLIKAILDEDIQLIGMHGVQPDVIGVLEKIHTMKYNQAYAYWERIEELDQKLGNTNFLDNVHNKITEYFSNLHGNDLMRTKRNPMHILCVYEEVSGQNIIGSEKPDGTYKKDVADYVLDTFASHVLLHATPSRVVYDYAQDLTLTPLSDIIGQKARQLLESGENREVVRQRFHNLAQYDEKLRTVNVYAE